MASSSYRANVVAFRMNPRSMLSLSANVFTSDLGKLWESDERKFDLSIRNGVFYAHAALSNYVETSPNVGILRFYGTNHDCRETLLSEIRAGLKVLEHYNEYNVGYERSETKFVNPTVFIEYFEQYGADLHEDRIQLILSFAERFLHHEGGAGFSVKRHGKSIILSYRNVDEPRHYTASLILWIFRNTEIMEDCLKNVNTSESKDKLWDYLSESFLKNSSWGNEANSVTALSLFSYYYIQSKYGTTSSVPFNGPVNFSQNGIPIDIVLGWIEKVLYKVFPYRIDIVSTQLCYCGEGFRQTILHLWKQLTLINKANSEAKEQKVSKNASKEKE